MYGSSVCTADTELNEKRVNKQCLLNNPPQGDSLPQKLFWQYNLFMQMFNGCTSCRYDIKLFHQKSKTEVRVDRLAKALTCKKN